MASFSLEDFTQRLIAETLLYDEEYGVYSNLSLIDPSARQERYIASYLPEEDTYVIESATEWEQDYDPEEDEDIGYALAVNSEEHETYETPEETAAVLLALAQEQNLLPSITLLFEEDGVE